MTEAMPFLQKAILLSYAPRPLGAGVKEGENTILHDALYCKTQNEKAD